MQLKFYAKPGHVVHRPGTKSTGQIAHYVGRRFVRSEGTVTAGAHVAQREPAEFDSDGPEAAQLLRYAAKGGLWPADEATAAACGVAFQKLKFDDAQAEWVLDTAGAAKSTPTPKAE